MANLSKIKRDKMIAFLEELKKTHADDDSIRAFNEIENHLREKKYGLVWEEHSEEVDELLEENIPILTADLERRLCKDESLPWNFIIEGDNLQALYLLGKTHRGKVDCIYIDPPYNTGARDWKYNNDYVDGNDVYRHSKWLSMMKNRLTIAKQLLNPDDSVLIVTIDEKEYLHLGCLLEEMFPTSIIQMITTVINPKGSFKDGLFTRCDEYIFFIFNGYSRIEGAETDFLFPLVKTDVRWPSLKRTGTHSMRNDRPNLFYPLFYDKISKKYIGCGDTIPLGVDRESVTPPDGCVAVWPLDTAGNERIWQLSSERLNHLATEGLVDFGTLKNGTASPYYVSAGLYQQIQDGEIVIVGYENGVAKLDYANGTRKSMPKTTWNMTSHSASEHGTNVVKSILGGNRFTFPKSIYAVRDTIKLFCAKKKNAIVIDFFAGSGTTMHATNLLNAEDGGNRTCIMVSNNEISEAEEKEFTKRGLKKGDAEWEEKGIAKYVTWPRTVCSINGVDVNGNALKGNYFGSDIPMADGFKANVKYFKCSWTPRKPEDYLLSNALCLHIKEMIELQNAIEVDNVKNVLILNKRDFKDIVENPDIYEKIENIWVNQNIILNAEELKLLEAKGFKYIPREFFGQELREAAE